MDLWRLLPQQGLPFITADGIVDKVKGFLAEKFPDNLDRPALLYFTEDGGIGIERFGCACRGGRKLFLEEQLKLAKLAALRFWNLLKQ